MKLNELSQNFELKNTLSSLRLPTNPNNIPYESRNNIQNNINKYIYEIKGLLKDMKENEHRTTNFATILYIEENNYEKMSMDALKLKLKKDFSLNKNMFVNSRNNTPFESERNLIQSMHASISRNKSFITEIIKNKKYVSLNQPKALEYLKKMYGKYTSTFNGDITSMASIDSKKSKINFNDNTRSERKLRSKNLIGNKTLRSNCINKYEDIIGDEEEQKIKYLKDNLQEIKPKNGKKNGKNGKNEKSNNFFEKNLNISKNIEQTKKNPSLSLFIKEIDNSINTFDDTQKIISSYKAKLNQLKLNIKDKESKIKDYENAKINVNSIQKQLNILYEIMTIKLGTIQSTKEHKYYGEIFPKAKNLALNYKFLFDNKIDDIKKNMFEMNSIKSDFNKKNEIIPEIRNIDINEIDKGIIYLVKNEIKKEANNIIKKMRNDIIIDNLSDDEFNNNDINVFIEEIKKKFNDIAQEITEEKEIFE